MSSIHVNMVQRLRAYIEPNGSLGTDHSGTLGDFIDLPIIEGSCEATLEQPTKDPAHIRQERDDHSEEILGVKRAKVKFSLNLGPATARAGSGSAMAETPVGRLLGLIMGGTNLGTGDAAAAGCTTTVVNVSTGSRWQAGGCLGWADSSGVMHLREVESVSSNAVTLKLALPSAPVTSDPIYNCATYYLGNHDSDSVTTLQLVLEGLGNAGDGYHESWVLLGGQAVEPPTFELSNGEIPKVTFQFSFANWAHGDEAAITPAALALATYLNTTELLIVDSSFRSPTVGSSTLSGTEYHPSEYTFEPGFKYVEQSSPGGVNNIAAYVLDGTHPKITGSFKLPYQDQTWFDARNARTAKSILLQIGSSETYGALLVTAPTVQITDFQRVDIDGLMGQSVNWKGRSDDETSEGTATVLGRSPFRIHFA